MGVTLIPTRCDTSLTPVFGRKRKKKKRRKSIGKKEGMEKKKKKKYSYSQKCE